MILYICIMAKKVKLPADTNKRAKSIVDLATGDSEDTGITPDGKNAAAVALGRLGGQKGGKARAESLTAKKRSEIAKKAAAARWKKD
jgi:transcription initiation factor TFIIIB Brf1 subunit/transcription initiation factor TFIIB